MVKKLLHRPRLFGRRQPDAMRDQADRGLSAASMSGSSIQVFGWAKKKTPKIDRKALGVEVGEIITDYGEFISNNFGIAVIRDADRLPHDKEKIIMALCFAIATSRHIRDAQIPG